MENSQGFIRDIEQLLARAKKLQTVGYTDPAFQIWKSEAEDKLVSILGDNSARVQYFKKLLFHYAFFGVPIKGISDNVIQHQNQFKADFEVAQGIVLSCLEELKTRVVTHESKEALLVNKIETEQKSSVLVQSDLDQPLSLEEACSFLKLAPQTIYGYTSKNAIPHIKKGKKLYFYKSELVNWLKSEKSSTKTD